MELTLQPAGGRILRVQCAGEICLHDMRPGINPLAEVLGPNGFAHQVLLNLEKCTFIDSSGVSWLISSHKSFAADGGALVIHSIPPSVLQVLRLLRMELVLRLAEDEPAARAALPAE